MHSLKIAKIMYGTETEGPGKRAAIWLQGCSLRCKGCINKDIQDKEGGEWITFVDIVTELKKTGLTKLTILGGEPLEQVDGLMAFMLYAKTHIPELTTMLFTGFDKIKAKSILSFGWKAFDIIITGPYDETLPDDRKWIGSSNQVINFVSQNALDWAAAHPWPKKVGKEFEFSYDATGAYINGL